MKKMEQQPGTSARATASTSRAAAMAMVAGAGQQQQQQVIVQQQRIPGPSARPSLASPVQVPEHFIVPQDKLLPHQVSSGIDIVNLFKLLNALQNRIALACSQHQYLSDPTKHPKPPDDGGYKPHTKQAAVRDIRSLCRQQKNLMEKLRKWNCLNEGKCYDLINNKIFTGICKRCVQFAIARKGEQRAGKALRKQKRAKATARRKAIKAAQKRKAAAAANEQKVAHRLVMAPIMMPPPPSPPRKRRKRMFEPMHPDSFISQENFLSELGLVTPEVCQRKVEEAKRTERRRRTTANPKYKSNVFVDPNVVMPSKRSRRSDPESLQTPQVNLSSRTGADRRKARQKRYECSVCEKKDVKIQCTGCLSGFHAECIRVTASKAKAPETVPVCPNCVKCNPNVSASDCILLSRRVNRPSIMGVKPTKGKRAVASNKNSPSAKSQSSAKKKATASNSKAAQNNSTSPDSCFKKPQPVKRLKATQSGKNSFAKRTLNHSLAVAAAAAVPAACCTSVSTVADTASIPEAKESPPSCSKEKVTTPPVVSIKWKNNNSKLRSRPYPKREVSPTPPPPVTQMEAVISQPKRKVAVKAAPLFTSSSPVIPNSKSAPKKSASAQENGCSKKAQTQNQTISDQPPQVLSKKSPAETKKQAKLPKKLTKKAEEGSIVVEAPLSSPKSTKGKPKEPKISNNSPKPVRSFDSFKQTAMAMAAAAGLVMSNNSTRAINVSSEPSIVSPVSTVAPAPASPKVAATGEAESLSTPSEAVASTPKRPAEPGPSEVRAKKPKEKQISAATIKKKSPKPKPTPKMSSALEQSILDTISRVVADFNKTPDDDNMVVGQKIGKNMTDGVEKSLTALEKMNTASKTSIFCSQPQKSPILKESMKQHSFTDDFSFDDCGKYFTNAKDNIPLESERCVSPASNSSTLGSPRSLRDLDSDSSDDLLSIPDTPVPPYFELERLERNGPHLDLSALDRLNLPSKKVTPSSTSPGSAAKANGPNKKGRPAGKGRTSQN